VIDGIRAHRALTTNAPFIEMFAGDKTVGDTVQGNAIEVRIRVRAPSWAKVDKLTVYSNSAVVTPTPITIPADQGTDFETRVMIRPTTDAWVVAEATGTQNMFPVISPVEFPPLDATIILGALSAGFDLSTLPVTAKLRPNRIHTATPYAITNPIWIDRAGDGWTPPKAPLPKRVAPAKKLPDVRAQFDALPEVSP